MSLEDTVDDEGALPFAARYREALGQTISEEDFSAMAIQTIAEDWGNDQGEDRLQGVMFNLLETIEDSEYANEIDFRLASDEVHLKGDDALGPDPFEEDRPNRYVIHGMLGSGGMGQVFDVLDTNFDRHIAVKFLHPKAASQASKMEGFLREARLTAQLEHPNIFPVHDVNISDGGMPYFSMRKAQGESLRELIDDVKLDYIPDPIAHYNDRVSIIIKVCDAIAYAHSQGLIHQDIKPSNIMIGDYGEVIVVDWGTARDLSEESETEEKPKLQGTPIYMSPEQARREQSTICSDIYCIASTFFHLLTFRFPTWSDDPDAFWDLKKQGIISQITEEELRQVPAALLSIVLKGMHADPEQRYQSVLEMREDLINYQRGLKVSSHRDTALDVLKRFYRLNKKSFWSAVFTGLILCVLGYAMYLELQKSKSEWRVINELDFNTDSLSDLQNNWSGFTFYKFNERKVYPLTIDKSSPWSLKGGALYIDAQNSGNNYYNFSYKHHIPGDMRVEWDVTPLNDTNDVNCYIAASNRFDGYHFHLAGNNAATRQTYLTKKEDFILHDNVPFFNIDQTYRMRIEKEQEYIRLFVNNKLAMEYRDIDILRGPGRHTFGFESLRGSVKIDNIKISSRPLPQKISPILVANSLYSNGHYTKAIEHYEDITRAYPDSELDALATYYKGRSYSQLNKFEDALIAFNEFRYRYPDHEMSGYVLRDIGLNYIRKGQWDLSFKYFDEIASNYTDKSLRASSFRAIERNLWNIIDPTDDTQLIQADAVEKALRIEAILKEWSEKFGLETAPFNSVHVMLPTVYMSRYMFDKIKQDYDLEHWPWAMFGVYEALGEHEQLIEHARRKGHALDRVLMSLGRHQEVIDTMPNNIDALRGAYVELGNLEELKKLTDDPNDRIFDLYALRQGDYQSLSSKKSTDQDIYFNTLMGLKRYEDIINHGFINKEYGIDLAKIYLGKEQEILDRYKDKPYHRSYIKALGSMMYKSFKDENHEQFERYAVEMKGINFNYDSVNLREVGFEYFALGPFLKALKSKDIQQLKLNYQQLLDDPNFGQLSFIKGMTAVILGEPLEDRHRLSIEKTELGYDLCKGIHFELHGKPEQAIKHYRTAINDRVQHLQSLPSIIAVDRIKVLSK